MALADPTEVHWGKPWSNFYQFQAVFSENVAKQEIIPVGCVPPTWKQYMLQWLPPDVTGGGSNEHVWTGLQWWPPAVTSNGTRARRTLGLMSVGGGKGQGQGVPRFDWRGGGMGCTVKLWVMITCDPYLDKVTETQLKTLASRNFVGGQ